MKESDFANKSRFPNESRLAHKSFRTVLVFLESFVSQTSLVYRTFYQSSFLTSLVSQTSLPKRAFLNESRLSITLPVSFFDESRFVGTRQVFLNELRPRGRVSTYVIETIFNEAI